MRVWNWGWLCLSLGLLGCPPPPLLGECGGNFCTVDERCESSTLLCVPDALPVLTAAGPAGVVATTTFVISGTMTDDVGIKAASWKIGTGAWTGFVLDSAGRFSLTIDAPELDSQNAFVTVRAQDDRREVTKDVAVKIDRVGPVLRLLRPDEGTLISTPTVEVAVDATDGSGTLSGVVIAGIAEPSAVSGNLGVRTLDVPSTCNGDPLPFDVTAADGLGNATMQTFSLRCDRVAPVITFVTPAANQFVSSATLSVEVQVTDPSSVSGVTMQMGQAGPVAASETSPGQWVASLPIAMEDAFYEITVDATDAAGNVARLGRTVHVDRIAPTLTVSTPAQSSLHRADILVSAITTADTASVTATLEGQMVSLTGGPLSWNGVLTVPSRDYSATSIRVAALDLAGNSQTADVAITVDTVAPVLTITSPTAGQKFNASQFASSGNVTVTWTVADADPQAGTSTVNGSPSTATSLQVATAPTDNPRAYSTAVVASDRAGNTSSRSIGFTVDRVLPSITSWAPAANARNVERNDSIIDFSEPVFGPLTTSPGLVLAGYTPTADLWFNAHASYFLPLDAFGGRLLDVSVPSLADDHGNALPTTAARRFHLASYFQPNTNRLIMTDVREFDATSDADGVVSVGLITVQGILIAYKDVGIGSPQLSFPAVSTPTRVAVNSWNVVNGSTLQSSHRLGVTTFNSALAAGFQYARSAFLDGVNQGAAVSSGPAAIVSRPPLANEPVPATEIFGGIVGTQYARNTILRTLPNAGVMTVAQSNDSWAAFETTSSKVLWSHYRCRALIVGGYDCFGIGYGANATSPSLVQAAMTPAGNCLAVTWNAGGARQVLWQTLASCDVAACPDDTNLPTATLSNDLRVAPFGANGENTLLFSFRPSANELRLSKMSAGTCGPTGATLATLTLPFPAKAHLPIRAGNKPAVLYISSSDELRLWVP
jgi:hypothetical protein